MSGGRRMHHVVRGVRMRGIWTPVMVMMSKRCPPPSLMMRGRGRRGAMCHPPTMW